MKNGLLNIKIVDGEMSEFYLGKPIVELACGHKLELVSQQTPIKETDSPAPTSTLQTKPSDIVTLRW